MGTFFTIGHGKRPIEELIAVLTEAGVETLIDVRRTPQSRWNPQFGRAALERDLPEAGIAYEWWGAELGGRREPVTDGASRHPGWKDPIFRAYADHTDTEVFRDAIERLEEVAAPAVMCAETDWHKCHRQLIADALTARGHEVVHLIHVGDREAHVPHPAMRIEDGRPVYDLGETGALDL